MKQTDPAMSQTRRRKNRPRPTPKWLLRREGTPDVAKARCLMVLEVLSGERPVTEVIEAAGISRGTYYQLETRAIAAMLKALGPAPLEEASGPPSSKRIGELEEKVKLLEQGRRRTKRLLLLTRKVVRSGVTLRGKRTASTGTGRSPLRSSRKLKASLSIPTPAGEGEP
jgi:hypothetical protein